MDTQKMMGLGKGDSFKLWPFLVSIRSISGVDYFEPQGGGDV